MNGLYNITVVLGECEVSMAVQVHIVLPNPHDTKKVGDFVGDACSHGHVFSVVRQFRNIS